MAWFTGREDFLQRALAEQGLLTPAASTKPLPEKTKMPRTVKLIPAHWSVTLRLPCRVKSEANQRDHWSKRRRRFQEQSEMLWMALLSSPFAFGADCLPVRVTFIHVGRAMDSDNLAGAFKGMRDAVALRLFRVDDADPGIEWHYSQRAPVDGQGVEVRIESAKE